MEAERYELDELRRPSKRVCSPVADAKGWGRAGEADGFLGSATLPAASEARDVVGGAGLAAVPRRDAEQDKIDSGIDICTATSMHNSPVVLAEHLAARALRQGARARAPHLSAQTPA